MERFLKVNVLKYVKNGIQNGSMKPIKAIKFARIIARQGNIGEKGISWSIDEKGNEIQEKIDIVKIDEQTGNPGWVVTKVDENGNIIIDENGHCNQWIISDSYFKKKYEIDPNNDDIFKPVGGIQVFVKIDENIILNQWGSDMKIAKGGYINITNLDDMYGNRDFYDTYREIDNEKEIKKK